MGDIFSLRLFMFGILGNRATNVRVELGARAVRSFSCRLGFHRLLRFQTISWVSKLDSQLYPVITTDSNDSKEIATYLQQKLDTVLPDIKRAQSEVEQRIKTAETLISKSQTSDEKTLNVKNKLNELNQKLTEITTEYQILLEVLIAYFKNLAEVDKTVENLNAQFGKAGLPNDVAAVESLIKEHEASKQAVLEMFRFTQSEREQITNRIRRQVKAKPLEKRQTSSVVSGTAGGRRKGHRKAAEGARAAKDLLRAAEQRQTRVPGGAPPALPVRQRPEAHQRDPRRFGPATDGRQGSIRRVLGRFQSHVFGVRLFREDDRCEF